MVIAFKRSAGFGGRGVRSGWNAVRRQVLSNARKIWSNVNSPNLPSPRGGLKFGGKILGGLGAAIAAELLFPPPVSDGTIPAWISNVPQINEIEPPPPPPFSGGQSPAVLYRVTFTYKISDQGDFITSNQNVWGSVRGLFVDVYSPTIKVLRIKAGDGTIADNEKNYDMKFAGNSPNAFPYYKIDSVVRANGQPDTGGNIETGEGISSAPPPNFPPPLTSPKSGSASASKNRLSNYSPPPPPASNNSAPNNTNSGEFGKQINGGPGSIVFNSPAPTGNPAPGAVGSSNKTTTTKGNVTTKYLQGSGGTAWSINQTSIGSSNSSGTTTTTKYDSNNSNQTIEQRLNAQLDNINNPDTNNTENLTTPIPKSKDKSDFNIDNFKRDLEDFFTTTVIAGVTPTLLNIQSQTTPVSQQTNTRAAICDSTNPGGCINSNVLQPLQAGQANNLNLFSSLFANLNDQLVQNPLLQKIDATTTGTSEFVKKAWRTTRVGKILEYLSLAVTLHNAAMLSRNLGASLGDAISAIANNTISLIKNEEDNSIDINETLGNTIEGFLTSVLGAANYQNLSETFSKYNRIVNAAANVTYSILSIQAGLAEGLETIGNYTGRIGNALKKSGAVLENSYSWMSEKVSVKTGRLGQIQAILNTGEGIENFASEIQNATSEFREAQENVNQIGEQITSVKSEFTNAETEKDTAETTTKSNSQATQPELSDFVPDPIE